MNKPESSSVHDANTYFEFRSAGMRTFASSEHEEIGKKVKLEGLEEDTPLMTRSGISINFHHIVALAGDFYGVPNQAISLPGGSDNEKTVRFKSAFTTLKRAFDTSTNLHELEVVKAIVESIQKEHQEITSVGTPHQCYSRTMIERGQSNKKIKPDIDELLMDNSDHFCENAKEAYSIGHSWALHEARKAGKTQNIDGLKLAYAIDAFACHFLTDLFAAGHIRNQRGPLESFLKDRLKFSEVLAKRLSALLTGAQHEKDGKGLEVIDEEDSLPWMAYGDGYFFTQGQKQFLKVIAAVQTSVNEIFDAYKSFNIPQESKVKKLIPIVTKNNQPPLYEIIVQDKKAVSLFVFSPDGKRVEIKSKGQYIKEGVLRASLANIPQEYIDSVINVQLPKAISPAVHQIFHLVERITGIFWGSLGIASSNALKKEAGIINDKVDEMALRLRDIFHNTVIILDKIDSVLDYQLLSPIRISSAVILDAIHELKTYHEISDLDRSLKKIWKAQITLSRYFQNDGDIRPLEVVLEHFKKKSDIDARKQTSLWFRKMLNRQITAFEMCMTLGDRSLEEINKLTDIFIKDLEHQIELNKDYIYPNLVLSEH